MPAALPPHLRKTEIRLTRFTPDESAHLTKVAAERGLPVAAVIHAATLHAIDNKPTGPASR